MDEHCSNAHTLHTQESVISYTARTLLPAVFGHNGTLSLSQLTNNEFFYDVQRRGRSSHLAMSLCLVHSPDLNVGFLSFYLSRQ